MTPPPVPPRTAETPDFIAELRRLKAWSGLSYRELERAATAAGEVLPYSTAATMLRRDRLPRETVLVAFVVACGLDADDTRRWVAARRELAMGAQPSPPPVTPATPITPVTPATPITPVTPAAPIAPIASVTPAAPAADPPVQRRRSRLRLALVGVATAVAVLAGAGAAALGTISVQEEQVEVSTQQP
ncbi:helix-turn-helix domain-containing protein [Streptomyces longisporoflavus]|uniref:Helix-turn-helix domain-containing protein n=1 Tax=Streptomyces longisporoflavus TaxID=28044 RepID=A0ABW7R564_9ACTN